MVQSKNVEEKFAICEQWGGFWGETVLNLQDSHWHERQISLLSIS